MFGIPEDGGTQRESYDVSVRRVVQALNCVAGPKQWSDKDIASAHRVGKKMDGDSRPMLVTFTRWSDKMVVITNQAYRSDLNKKGIRVASDLTKKQASLVAAARREGKIAYFKGGKLVVGPKQNETPVADSRQSGDGGWRFGAGVSQTATRTWHSAGGSGVQG
jgi:hypothetical protein